LQRDKVVQAQRVEIEHHLEASEAHVVEHLSQAAILLRALANSHSMQSLLFNGSDADAKLDLKDVFSPLVSHIEEFSLLDASGMERLRLRRGEGGGMQYLPSEELVLRASSACFQAASDIPAGHVYLSPVSVPSSAHTDDTHLLPLLHIAMPVNSDKAGDGAASLMVLSFNARDLYWHHAMSPLPGSGSLRRIEDGFVYQLKGDQVEVLRQQGLPDERRVLRQERVVHPAAWLPLDVSQQQIAWHFSEGLPEDWLMAQLHGEEVAAWAVWSVGSVWMLLMLVLLANSRRNSLLADDERQRLLVKMKGLSRRLISVHEDEQRMLARVLHDDVGQSLTAVQMRLAGLAMDCEGDGCDAAARVREEEAYIAKMIETLCSELRKIKPPELEALGLRGALLSRLEEMSRQLGLEVEADIAATVNELDDLLSLAIYRLVQETLTNTVRHAAASSVRLRMGVQDGWVECLIEDDGCGFDVTQASNGFGLIGLRERVESLGGRMTMNSAPGEGTRLEFLLPVHFEEQA